MPDQVRHDGKKWQLLGILFGLSFALATPAAAQQTTPRGPSAYDRAIAAGYKALTLCSAMFNGDGRTQAQVEALELNGIYPEYDSIVPTLDARVQPDTNGVTARVEVGFDSAMPPRIAHWVVGEGCRILPIGSTGRGGGERWIVDGRNLLHVQDEYPWPRGNRMPAMRTNTALDTPVAHAFDGAHYGTGRTTGVVILHDGRIVAERYAEGFGPHVAQRTWSVAKSIAGTLIGMAVKDGLLDPQAAARIPEWQDGPRRAIRLDQLLRMASGLYNNPAGNRTDATYFGGTSLTQEIASWPLATAPGTHFRYANNDILAAVRSLRAALNDDDRYHAFPQQRLFAPLGMTRTVAETDWQGNFIFSSQVWSTARDLARLGQFWLQDGVWEGQRLLPEGWMGYMTSPSGPQPPSGPGYGATLWLFGPTQGLPAGSYAAQGNRGQYVMVVPSRRLVIVRRGEDGTGMRFDIARFTADVVAALPEGAAQ